MSEPTTVITREWLNNAKTWLEGAFATPWHSEDGGYNVRSADKFAVARFSGVTSAHFAINAANCWHSVLAALEVAWNRIEKMTSIIVERDREIDDLRRWRINVTTALGRSGGTAYADVPVLIKDLRAHRDNLQSAVTHLEDRVTEQTNYARHAGDECAELLGRLAAANAEIRTLQDTIERHNAGAAPGVVETSLRAQLANVIKDRDLWRSYYTQLSTRYNSQVDASRAYLNKSDEHAKTIATLREDLKRSEADRVESAKRYDEQSRRQQSKIDKQAADVRMWQAKYESAVPLHVKPGGVYAVKLSAADTDRDVVRAGTGACEAKQGKQTEPTTAERLTTLETRVDRFADHEMRLTKLEWQEEARERARFERLYYVRPSY